MRFQQHRIWILHESKTLSNEKTSEDVSKFVSALNSDVFCSRRDGILTVFFDLSNQFEIFLTESNNPDRNPHSDRLNQPNRLSHRHIGKSQDHAPE